VYDENKGAELAKGEVDVKREEVKEKWGKK